MKIEQKKWAKSGWETLSDNSLGAHANWVLVFGSRDALSNPDRFNEIKAMYPTATIFSCSTSGEIMDVEVSDETISLSAVQFESTELRFAQAKISDFGDSASAGKKLAEDLKADGLKLIFVLSDGLHVNGSELVKGFNSNLPQGVIVTGGLAGDAARFEKTLIGINSVPESGNIVAVGFYGDKLRVGHGSKGGWDAFGPVRKITKSKGNILYELDGKPALNLYKNYLGDQAGGLPATGLLFPLSVQITANSLPVVRTLLGVSEEDQSMTFAGDIPEGSTAQLMKANFEKIIEGACDAAEATQTGLNADAELAILISCVGRKLILGQRIEEEVEGVRDILGEKTALTGFYSYGEISPLTPNANCELHNQTMTITTLSES